MGVAPSLYIKSYYLPEPEPIGWKNKVARAFWSFMGEKGRPATEIVELSPERWAQHCQDVKANSDAETKTGIYKELEQGTVFVVVPQGYRFDFSWKTYAGYLNIEVFNPTGSWVGGIVADNRPGIHVFKKIPAPPKPKPIRRYEDPPGVIEPKST